MAEGSSADVLIQDTDRAPIDNRPFPGSSKSQTGPNPMQDGSNPPVIKKKRHTKKGLLKEKRSKDDQSTTTTQNPAPQDEVIIPPEVITALKRSTEMT